MTNDAQPPNSPAIHTSAPELLDLVDEQFRAAWIVMTDADRAKLPADVRARGIDRYRKLTPWVDESIRRGAGNERAAPPATNIVTLDPAGGWPEPMLPAAIHLPPLNGDIIPGCVGELASIVSEATQAPAALSLMIGLSVLAACVQRGWTVQPTASPDYTEPTSVWVLVGAASGERKTVVLQHMTDPLRAWEKNERDRMRPDIARNFAARAVAEKRIERLKNDAARADEQRDRDRLQGEIQRERETMPAELFAPRLYVNDVTSERLQGMLVENLGAIAIMSDEAAVLGVLSGIYNSGQAVLDVLLQGHAGSPVRVERQGRQAYIDRPAVSIALAIQPGVIAEACASPRFRHSGLLARFLFALPASNMGHRDVRRAIKIPDDLRGRYAALIHSLLDAQRESREPRVMLVTEKAREVWYSFAERLEHEMGDGGKLTHITDWAGKAPGAVARVAALFELAERGPAADEVSLRSMERAVQLGDLLIPHAIAAFRLVGADEVEADALAVVAWLRAGRRLEFTRRELHRAHESRLRTAERVLRTCDRLIEWAVIGPEQRRATKGGRPTAVYAVNPRVLS